jgi:methyltransferase family protein
MSDDQFVQWFGALERRHLANLSFSEVRKAVQALSSLYVERRDRIDTGAAFGGAGKRAAFALYFSPLHFLLVREIVRSLGAGLPGDSRILDVGCGTGVAGCAWAVASEPPARVTGMDRNSWALRECRWNYDRFRIDGTLKATDISHVRIPSNTAVIAAFAVNELDPVSRDRLLRDLLKTAENGSPVLIVEPIARRSTPWWDDWSREWLGAGGRDDEWRFPIDLPERLALMDKAAGLNHRELTGRSLWLPGLK